MGLDTTLDQLELRLATLQAEVAIIVELKQGVSADLSIDSNRESAKVIATQQYEAAVALPFSGCESVDRDLLLTQLGAVRDALG